MILRLPKGPARRGLAAALLAVGVLSAAPAHALTLGRLEVASALGEPLRAEIEIRDLNPADAATLKASLAPAGVYQAAGIEFAAVLRSARVTVDRRADGRAVLRLSSDQPARDPFVDVIVQLEWATGRMVR